MSATSGERRELSGAMTALVTPFTEDGGLDRAALETLAAWQIERGIHGLVPCGTTGEGATLTDEEHAQVIETVVRIAAGRVPVVAGCGSNNTRRTVAAARRAHPLRRYAPLCFTLAEQPSLRSQRPDLSARDTALHPADPHRLPAGGCGGFTILVGRRTWPRPAAGTCI